MEETMSCSSWASEADVSEKRCLVDVKGQVLTCGVMSSEVYFGVPHGDRIENQDIGVRRSGGLTIVP